MIVDVHGHTVAPPEVYEYQAKLIARRAPFKAPELSDERLGSVLDGHVGLLDEVGTDIQFLSPRPYTMMHSLFNAGVVRAWTTFVNDVIHRQCGLRPDRFRAVAGLPQFRTDPLESILEELERCVEMGFVGCVLNPDPMEGEGPPPPGLGDEYWYPLYEKLSQLDVPAMIHSAACAAPRESYSVHFINEETIAVVGLLGSKVFEDFPDLRIVVSHGGGAVPYQLGRFRSPAIRRGDGDRFTERFRRLAFDTCVYSPEGLDLLFTVAGPEACLFGTERPGTGRAVDPSTGRSLDDLRPVIEGLATLTPADRELVFEGNARRIYTKAFDGSGDPAADRAPDDEGEARG
ncbi:MAG: amidohydrolase family protein [Actinomycetota bacterium]